MSLKERFFKLKGNFNINQIAEFLNANIENFGADLNTNINDIKNIEDASKGDLTFINNRKYFNLIEKTKASICIIPQDYKIDFKLENIALLRVDDSYFAYSKLLKLFFEEIKSESDKHISETAEIGSNVHIGVGSVIEDNVKIGDNVYIGNNVVIKQGVEIGENSKILDSSYISFSVMGSNVLIHPGARIGTDGFGFATYKGVHHKILHVGIVEIGDNVEIGANTTIDRGSNKNTKIGNGTIIDNQVQIGHNVEIGMGSIIVAQVGIAGSTKIGNYVAIGGQAGINGHIEITDMVQISAKSGILKSIDDKGAIYGGYPAVPIREWHKQTIAMKKLVNQKR